MPNLPVNIEKPLESHDWKIIKGDSMAGDFGKETLLGLNMSLLAQSETKQLCT